MSRPEYHHCFLSNASNIPCVLGLLVCRSFGPEVGLACGMSRTVLDLCSTVLGASTRRSPASCLRTHGARGRLFAVGSTCCLSARPAAPLHCWPLRVQSARTRSVGEAIPERHWGRSDPWVSPPGECVSFTSDTLVFPVELPGGSKPSLPEPFLVEPAIVLTEGVLVIVNLELGWSLH